MLTGSRDGAVVRALASHHCGPGSIPRPGVICGLSLCWFSTLLRGFFSGYSGFPPSAKTDTQLIRAGCWLCSKVMHGPYSGCQWRLNMHCQKFGSKWRTRVRVASLMGAQSCEKMYGISTKIQNKTNTS